MGVGCAKKFLAGIFNGATNLPVGIRMSNIEQGISNSRSFLKQKINILYFDMLRFLVLQFCG